MCDKLTHFVDHTDTLVEVAIYRHPASRIVSNYIRYLWDRESREILGFLRARIYLYAMLGLGVCPL